VAHIYENESAIKKIVELGRRMISKCEYEGAFKDDDEMWNNAVTAGNRLCTIGTTWGIQSVTDLSPQEQKAVKTFLDLQL
jgi:hypothetical protein